MEEIKITSKEQALRMVENILRALDQLQVQGRHNCFVVTAVCNDLDILKDYLKDSARADN